MKRQNYRVTVIRADQSVLAESVKFAMNAGITESERLVREYVRSVGTIAEGQRPTREGDVYTRMWTTRTNETISAKVEKL